MGRWSERESDEERLPEGIQRVGYDADTQRYIYQDEEGGQWEGAEGARYGRLERVNGTSHPLSAAEVAAQNHSLRDSNREAWRYLLPFALLFIFLLLLLFRFINSAPSITCPSQSEPYTIRSGDTCWAIAKDHGLDVPGLLRLNPGTDCAGLRVGGLLCVPMK
ncbi:carbohydrate-binding module family 50 protein [Lepidopterella palustris CBS 459.81]|uniref:Carbohydrate-binding module family 50 protein n=1 Tax=Lepidopterella palustris CBS 459.81 TaxID=1314670 RepID=A0A8E2JA92_9PEZI|nr:carbohydrate-binding module family 50 protein [Lepidopterella palustris CBS 459.81]